MEGEYKELEQEVNAMSKNHVKLQSEHKHAQEQYEAEQKHLEELTAAKEEVLSSDNAARPRTMASAWSKWLVLQGHEKLCLLFYW